MSVTTKRVIALSLTVCLGGCAGGDDTGGQSSDRSTAEKTTGSDANGRSLSTTQGIRVIRDGKAGPQRKRARVRPGDVVSLSTVVSSKEVPKGARLQIVVAAGPSRELAVRAGAEGAEPPVGARATSGGGRVRLERLRYTCQVPPAGFCPVEVSKERGEQYSFTLDAPRKKTPVVLVADVVRPR